MSTVTLSPEQAKSIIASIEKRCAEIGIEGVIDTEKLNVRDVRNFGEIIRECVLEFDEKRVADARAAKGKK